MDDCSLYFYDQRWFINSYELGGGRPTRCVTPKPTKVAKCIHGHELCSIKELSIEIQTFGGDSLENSFEDIFFAILLILIVKS